jgi:hypothetical protein
VGSNPGLRSEIPGTGRPSLLYVNSYKYGDGAKLRYCKPQAGKQFKQFIFQKIKPNNNNNIQQRSAYIFVVEKREGKSTLGDLGVDGILKWILKKGDRKAWIGFIWLGIRTTGGMLCTRY